MPQAHPGSRFTSRCRCVPRSASQRYRTPASEGAPSRTCIAAWAIAAPTTPHKGERTPASAQVGPAAGPVKEGRVIASATRRDPGNSPELRAIAGLYWHRITEESGRNFFADTWKVAPEADRIGYRFRGGRALEFVPRKQPFGAGSDPSNIVDACYPYGSIQVPGGTEPIVLHRDAVSGGGYMMVGTVISVDMDLIGQMQPHMAVKFVKVDMDEALAIRHERTKVLEQVRAALG